MKDEKIVLNVEGMTCASCASGISRHLHKKGLDDIFVDYNSGLVEATLKPGFSREKLCSEINSLGYHVIEKSEDDIHPSSKVSSVEKLFLVCLAFTLPLWLSMIPYFNSLENPVVQFLLAFPVLICGITYFGKSAWGSIKAMMPNMDVLILTGSIAAFSGSLYSWYFFGHIHQFMFFETSATIITLVMLGNIIEHRSLKKTESAITELIRIQPQIAHQVMEAFTPSEFIRDIKADYIKKQDLLMINSGERIPADGIIYHGEASIDQSMITGESMPVNKTVNERVLAGTIIISGSIKIVTEYAGHETVLGAMIISVKNSTRLKPAIQKSADKISAVFVPVVLLIAAGVMFISVLLGNSIGASLLRSIAVLVISCPCAMGLATPTAIAVALGKAAKEGFIIKKSDFFERMKNIKTVVFDKTGTLTTGELTVSEVVYFGEKNEVDFIIAHLESYSSHPIAKAISNHINKPENYSISFRDISEDKGFGVTAKDNNGNIYFVGSARNYSGEEFHKAQVAVTKNNNVLATVQLQDQLKNDAKDIVSFYKQKGIKTVLLSGDNNFQCEWVAKECGLDEYYSNVLPLEKSDFIRSKQTTAPVLMIGDGINDSAALAEAYVSIAMGNGSDIARDAADAVLLDRRSLIKLKSIYHLSRKTVTTIYQNFFWAFIYNIITIPFAAAGFINPMPAAMSMALSDVIVIGNSLRIRISKSAVN